MNEKQKIKKGIYLCSLLMMGAIAVASNLANIMAAFPDVAPTTIVAYLISLPCLIVIPVTLITGKLMDRFSKKSLIIVGILFWLIGGVAPYFLNSLTAIAIMRAIFGVGIGMIQTLCAALVVENFEDQAERNKTMGNVAAFQMLGTIIFSLVAGNLGAIGWHVAFLVHLIAVISLIGAIILLPNNIPTKQESSVAKIKFVATKFMWIWTLGLMIFMIGGQTYVNSASAIIEEFKLDDSIAAGYSLDIFALGGLLMGLFFGKVSQKFGKNTLLIGGGLMMLGVFVIALVPNLIVSYIGAFLCGASFSIIIPSALNGTAGSVDSESSEMAVSIATCAQNIGMAISPYVMTSLGALIVSWGLSINQATLLFAVDISGLGMLILYFVNKRK